MTNGHLDLISRARRVTDHLIVGVLQNEQKRALFTMDERVQMLKESLSEFPEVEVDSFNGLLADYAASRKANVIIRGIRAISDYEYELQMALMNRRLQPEIETVFLAANEAYSFVSSRLVREVAALGGNVEGLVPPSVARRLTERIRIEGK